MNVFALTSQFCRWKAVVTKSEKSVKVKDELDVAQFLTISSVHRFLLLICKDRSLCFLSLSQPQGQLEPQC